LNYYFLTEHYVYYVEWDKKTFLHFLCFKKLPFKTWLFLRCIFSKMNSWKYLRIFVDNFTTLYFTRISLWCVCHSYPNLRRFYKEISFSYSQSIILTVTNPRREFRNRPAISYATNYRYRSSKPFYMMQIIGCTRNLLMQITISIRARIKLLIMK